MKSFKLWMVILESGRFDREAFNRLFHDQLAELLPRVADSRRYASLEAMQEFDFVGYILTALRNAGFADPQEREQAAHDVAVYLLVAPGQLFAGYVPTGSGPMEARFALAVRNAVRNLLRTRSRSAARSPVFTGDRADAVFADKAAAHSGDAEGDNILADFRAYLRGQIGDIAVQLFDRRLDGVSLRRLSQESPFRSLNDWGVRRLIDRIRDAARDFVRSRGDEDLARALERVSRSREVREWLLPA